jgi:hypothetical protein
VSEHKDALWSDDEDEFWDLLVEHGMIDIPWLLETKQRTRLIVEEEFDPNNQEATIARVTERIEGDPSLAEAAARAHIWQSLILFFCQRRDGSFAVPPCEHCGATPPLREHETGLAGGRAEIATLAGFRNGRICAASRAHEEARHG